MRPNYIPRGDSLLPSTTLCVRLFPTSEATAHSVITADCWAEVRLGTKWAVTILKARTTGLGVRECLGLSDQYRTERLCN